VVTQSERFMGRYARRVAERRVKHYITGFCEGFPVEELQYAADNNLPIVQKLLTMFLLKPGKEEVSRQQAQPYRWLFDEIATVENVVRLFHEVSPQHAGVLESHPQWLESQIRTARIQVFGT
jgi:hypothetical protein